MGVFFCIEDEATGSDVPGWDWGLAGDRAMARLLIELPHLTRDGEEDYMRPLDFAEARAAGAKLDPEPNPGRWLQMLDLLEKNPGWWAYISW